MILLSEANTCTTHLSRTCVGRHNQNHVAEIRFTPVIVCQRAVIHHLKQDIEHFWVSLLNLIQQQHTVRCFIDSLRQQATLVITDVTRRRTNQT